MAEAEASYILDRQKLHDRLSVPSRFTVKVFDQRSFFRATMISNSRDEAG